MEKMIVSGSSTQKHEHGPWLVFLHEGKKLQTFFSLEEGKACRRTFCEMHRNQYWPTPQGWILILDVQLHRYFLLNSTTMAKIGLPPLKRKLSKSSKCFLSSSPTHPKCILMCADLEHRRLYYCSPGGNKWVLHKLEAWSVEEDELVQIASCNGTFYGMTSIGNFVIIDFAPLPQIRNLEGIHHELPIGFKSCNSYLLESCGELFQVLSMPGQHCSNKVLHFSVMKRNPKQEWEMVDSIGDRVFFLGIDNFAASWSASKMGIKGDRIYFTKEDDQSLYVFDMEEGSTQALLPCCNLRENWSTPIWIMPTL